MRSIIIAHVFIWLVFILAITPWYMLASNAMSACELRHSHEVCVTLLR